MRKIMKVLNSAISNTIKIFLHYPRKMGNRVNMTQKFWCSMRKNMLRKFWRSLCVCYTLKYMKGPTKGSLEFLQLLLQMSLLEIVTGKTVWKPICFFWQILFLAYLEKSPWPSIDIDGALPHFILCDTSGHFCSIVQLLFYNRHNFSKAII